jgi:hypothetical protein
VGAVVGTLLATTPDGDARLRTGSAGGVWTCDEAMGLTGVIGASVSVVVGGPKVAIGLDGKAEEGAEGGVMGGIEEDAAGGVVGGVDEAYGVAGAVLNGPFSEPVEGDEDVSGSGPPLDGNTVALENSTFGMAGHASAMPGGGADSGLFRFSET